MTLKKIRLELGRTPDHPQGSSLYGYDIIAPISHDGFLDAETWRAHKKQCTVHRFWEGEADEYGNLIHSRGNKWAISYEPGEEDNEPFFHLESHKLTEGEYVTITEHDGVARPFKIIRIQPF